MTIKIGGINIVNSLIDLELQVKLHQKIINWIYENHSDFRMPDENTLSKFKEESLNDLQKRYPDLGIEIKKILYVNCKNCRKRFKSPIQCDEDAFNTCAIKNNSYQCPMCKSDNVYNKEDHFFEY